jgi:hypothetical protein
MGIEEPASGWPLGVAEESEQLEKVFLPHTDRRPYASAGPVSLRFAHYTSAEAALKILEGKSIWMRNARCMSDCRELQHGYDALSRTFFGQVAERDLVLALDRCHPGAGAEAIAHFGHWWGGIRFDTHIASFSQHDADDVDGRLSMWRAFGGAAERVALIFNAPSPSPSVASLGLIFQRVAYVGDADVRLGVHRVAEAILANCDFLRSVGRSLIVGMVLVLLIVDVTCCKHSGFQDEKEWRVFYMPERLASPHMKRSVEVFGGVPQIVYHLPLSSEAAPDLGLAKSLHSVLVGPSKYPYATRDAFVQVLRNAGVPKPEEKVAVSGIPIRP